MAAAGVPIRTLMAMMGHEDMATTLIYADYAPNEHEVALVDAAFAMPDTVSAALMPVRHTSGPPGREGSRAGPRSH